MREENGKLYLNVGKHLMQPLNIYGKLLEQLFHYKKEKATRNSLKPDYIEQDFPVGISYEMIKDGQLCIATATIICLYLATEMGYEDSFFAESASSIGLEQSNKLKRRIQYIEDAVPTITDFSDFFEKNQCYPLKTEEDKSRLSKLLKKMLFVTDNYQDVLEEEDCTENAANRSANNLTKLTAKIDDLIACIEKYREKLK